MRLAVELNLGKDHGEVIMEGAGSGMTSVLDVGCGFNNPAMSWIYAKFGRANILSVGVDMFEPYLEVSIKNKVHDQYYQMDVREGLQVFGDKSFDLVIAIDLIEHMTKEEGLALIKEMERIAKKRVLISTPNGFVVNRIEDSPAVLQMSDGTKVKDFNQLMNHQSGWTVGEFRKLGYTVKGTIGSKWLFWLMTGHDPKRINQFHGKYKRLLLALSQVITYHVPSQAHQLVCWKDVG
jgi:ubiquinone/menaquinone biosynthesis C-methylase UbiE